MMLEVYCQMKVRLMIYRITSLLVDLDELVSDRVTLGRSLDLPVYFGDVGSREVLHKIGAERACAAVVALDSPGANYRCVWSLTKYYPNVKCFREILFRCEVPRHTEFVFSVNRNNNIFRLFLNLTGEIGAFEMANQGGGSSRKSFSFSGHSFQGRKKAS